MFFSLFYCYFLIDVAVDVIVVVAVANIIAVVGGVVKRLETLHFYILSGSIIHFSSGPGVVNTPFDAPLTLRCSMNDTSPNGAIIGRDLSQTPYNIEYVTSLVITGAKGVHIALVTPYKDPQALIDQNSINVTGQISGIGSGERG